MNVATSECPWCPADRFWCSHADRVETKSRHHWHFFSTLEKKSNDVFTFAIDEMFCFVSFEIPWEPTAALYEFSIYSWFKEWYSATTRYRFVSTPGTLAKFISRKTRVQLADLPKVRCERSVFSAPRQRMSVVEGREVIFYYIKKIRRVIFELSIIFLLHWASQQKSVRSLSGHFPDTVRSLTQDASTQAYPLKLRALIHWDSFSPLHQLSNEPFTLELRQWNMRSDLRTLACQNF